MAQNCGIFIVQKNIKNKGKNIKNKEIYLIIDILFVRMSRRYVNSSGFFLCWKTAINGMLIPSYETSPSRSNCFISSSSLTIR